MRVLVVVLLYGGMGRGGSPDDQKLPMDPPTEPNELQKSQLALLGFKFSERFGAVLETNDQDEVISLSPQWISNMTMTTSLKLTDELMLDLVKEMSKLQELELARTAVTDAGLVHLKGLTELRELHLDYTKITDAGLVHLKELTELQTLHLSGSKITDAGLVHLKGLTKMQTLDLRGTIFTKITDAGVADLQTALPNCEIVR